MRRIVIRRSQARVVVASMDVVHNHIHIRMLETEAYLGKVKADFEELLARSVLELRETNFQDRKVLRDSINVELGHLRQVNPNGVTHDELLVVQNRINYVFQELANLHDWAYQFAKNVTMTSQPYRTIYSPSGAYNGFNGEYNDRISRVPYDIRERIGKGV